MSTTENTSSAAGTRRPAPRQGMFTRQASGLVREIGVTAAVGISVGAVACVSALIAFPAYLAALPKADYYFPILGAAGFWLVVMFAYRYLVTAIPRAGGEYVYVSRIISPLAGALAGIATVLILIYTLAANVNIAAQFVPFMFTSLGAALHSSWFGNAAATLTGKTPVLLLSLGIMAAVAVASAMSLRRVAQVVTALVVLQLVALLAVAVLLLTHSHADFVAAFGRYSGRADAYEALLGLGHTSGVTFGVSVASMIALLPMGILLYNGVIYSQYAGGELRRPGRTYLYASAISIGILALAWVVIWGLSRHTVGLDFMQAQASVGAGQPGAYAKVTSLASNLGPLGYALVLSGDPVTKILIGVAIPVSTATVALSFTPLVARVLLALAFDRMLPIRVARVSDRTHAPVMAIVIVSTISALFLALLAEANLTSILSLLAIVLILVVIAGGIAATFLAHRRPDLAAATGDGTIPRWLGVARSTWWGGLATALGVFGIVEILVHRPAYLVWNATSVTTLVAVLLVGPVVYLITRAIRRRRGQIDLSMAMQELPPE